MTQKDNDAFAKTLPVVTDIPPGIMVPCPITGNQKYRQAVKCCPDCPYFRGIGAMVWSDEPEKMEEIEKLPWSQRYAIRCSTVMEWTCVEVEVEQ